VPVLFANRGSELLKTKPGCQLFHVFARLKLASYRHFSLRDVIPEDFIRWQNLTIYTQMMTVKDVDNGNSEFELVWVELLKIMGRFMELRRNMSPIEDLKLGSREYLAMGEEIEEMLRLWEDQLPRSFRPIKSPRAAESLEAQMPIVRELKPIYYGSLNIAVAMGMVSILCQY
jgi:hypothetical protein